MQNTQEMQHLKEMENAKQNEIKRQDSSFHEQIAKIQSEFQQERERLLDEHKKLTEETKKQVH